ncbi:MAG: hypothetical protein ACLQPD_25125 [Desulfomonilaceae bacterium]
MEDLKKTLCNFMEMARHKLLRAGDFDPLFVIVNPDRKPRFMTRNIQTMADRDALRAQVRKVIRKTKPIAAFGIALAWSVGPDHLQNYQGYLQDHPKRQEVITAWARDAHQHLMGRQEVYRSGNDISLGEEKISEGGESWLSDGKFYKNDTIYVRLMRGFNDLEDISCERQSFLNEAIYCATLR